MYVYMSVCVCILCLGGRGDIQKDNIVIVNKSVAEIVCYRKRRATEREETERGEG